MVVIFGLFVESRSDWCLEFLGEEMFREIYLGVVIFIFMVVFFFVLVLKVFILLFGLICRVILG